MPQHDLRASPAPSRRPRLTASPARYPALERGRLQLLAIRLGLRAGVAATLDPDARACGLPRTARIDLLIRVRREAARLARLGRGGDPRYDLDRHLALAALARRLAPEEPPLGAGPAGLQRRLP